MNARRIFYDTKATSNLKETVLSYVKNDGLTLQPFPLRPITDFQRSLEVEGSREGKTKAYIEGFYDGHSYEIRENNYLGQNTNLWPKAKDLGEELAKQLFKKDSIELISARVMLDGANRPLNFKVTIDETETEFYWKPFMASRILGNYLWNLLSGRSEHRFKASTTGIIEEAARGKHEWEIEDLVNDEYVHERFRAYILATHVGIGDFAIEENGVFEWKKSQYKVTSDKKIMPFDFDYLNLTRENYERQVTDLINLEGITRDLYEQLHAEEDEGLKTRYTLHNKRLKDLIKVIRPKILAAYAEGRKEKKSDEVIELFEFINNLSRNLKEHKK